VDRTVVEGHTARFEISVCAYPPATYQWSSNGIPLPNETNRYFFVRDCTTNLSGKSFCVRAANQLGSVYACATLFVTNVSPIRITELQANTNPGGDGHNDWFEITNFGQSAEQLQGYRFSDHFRLTDAQVVKRSLVIRPMESVIFVKNSSVGTFFEWWGPDQLPGDLQVLPYSGFSLSARGEALYLWDETAREKEEWLDGVSYSTNSSGMTLNFETDYFGHESAEGEGGTIKAVQSGDIGTPGFTAGWQPGDLRPQILTTRTIGNELTLSWRAGIFGGIYRVEFSEDLASGKWSTLVDNLAVNIGRSDIVTHESSISNSPMRFYRIVEVSR
jgi:hypothetical protein